MVVDEHRHDWILSPIGKVYFAKSNIINFFNDTSQSLQIARTIGENKSLHNVCFPVTKFYKSVHSKSLFALKSAAENIQIDANQAISLFNKKKYSINTTPNC